MGEWLESLVPWGTEALVWIQSWSSELMFGIFAFFTFLGYEEFYLLLLPLVYWCLNKEIGSNLGCIALSSAWLNNLVKYLFVIPRPADPRLLTPYPETSPSFPSGHSQNAIANWGYLAYRLRSRTFWIVAIVLILGISLSRLVLGVHFPQDVLGGWIIGLILLLVYTRAAPPIGRWLGGQPLVLQFALAGGVPILLIFLHPAGAGGLYPAEEALTSMGAMAGLGLGLVMERAWLRFSVEGEWWRRALRFVLGLIIVVVFYAGPKLILPEGLAHGQEAVLRFVRYSLVAWITIFACPWLFVRLRLAGRETG
jgi:membrane-associated phospholipid phosphatase